MSSQMLWNTDVLGYPPPSLNDGPTRAAARSVHWNYLDTPLTPLSERGSAYARVGTTADIGQGDITDIRGESGGR